MAVDKSKWIIEVDNKKGTLALKKFNEEGGRIPPMARGAGDSLINLGNIMRGAAVLGSIIALKKAFNFAEEVARVEKIAFGFKKMSESVGTDANILLADLKKLSDGTMSSVELMLKASSMAALSLPIDKAGEMLEIARAAAVAMGKSTEYMFESIVLGTARQSRLILDNLGIMIRETQIYEEASKRLGHELSNIEKRQEFLNEVLRQGQKLVGAVGDISGLTAVKFEKFHASIANVFNVFKELAAILTSPALQNLTWMAEDLATIVSKLAGMKEGVSDLTAMFDMNVRRWEEKFLNTAMSVEKIDGTYKQMSINAKKVFGDIYALQKEMDALSFSGAVVSEKEAAEMKVQMRQLEEKLADYQAAIQAYKNISNELYRGLPSVTGDLVPITGEYTEITDRIKKLNTETWEESWVKNLEVAKEAYNEWFNDLLEKNNNLWEWAQQGAEDYLRPLEDIMYQYDIGIERAERMRELWARLESHAGRMAMFLAQPVASGVGRMVSGLIRGQRAFENMKDFATQLVAQLAAAVAQAAALAILMSAMGMGGFGNLFKTFIGFQKGGRVPEGIQYAQGGMRFPSRGTDMIPAMLSPGEVVIPAATSRKAATGVGELQKGNVPARQQKVININFPQGFMIGDMRTFTRMVQEALARAEYA